MHIIKWTEDFAVGIGEIDDQHRTLVDMINDLGTSADEERASAVLSDLLGRLNDYVHDHFGFEERLMAGGGCTGELITRHRGEHAFFRSVLRDLTREFEEGRREISKALIEYLVHWFLHHIVVIDRAMASQLNASDPDLKQRIAESLPREMPGDMSDSERHLLAELRRVTEEAEWRVVEHTRQLEETNAGLVDELAAAKAEIDRLRTQLREGG